MSAVLSARGLTKRYGKQIAVDAIDFDIPAGFYQYPPERVCEIPEG